MKLFKKILYLTLLVLVPTIFIIGPIFFVTFHLLTPVALAAMPFAYIASYCLALVVSEDCYDKKE